MPPAWLSVRSTHARAIFFEQGADSRVTVHCFQHFKTDAIDSHDREVVVERGEPPFVFVMLVGDEIGDMPGEEREGLSCEAARLVNSDGWLHVGNTI